jgi:hypothetical protein
MLGFPWISLADSGLFNGLRAKKIKFSLALTTRVSGCVLTWPQTLSRSFSPCFGLAATPPRRGLFPAAKDKIA